ncbi:aldehyde dehydrogenase family protein [Acidovorax sp.]|uniref:aldehyde dehydrogenase family protein n=1 Tax=Acidovorax sp. TaxID=1872122 RepID=UPI00391F66CF
MHSEPLLSSLDPAADAALAAPVWAASCPPTRAALLQALAEVLEEHREPLVALAHEETHLGVARLNGELDRTCFQLRAFADLVLAGGLHAVEHDTAIGGPPPRGRPDMQRVLVPLGPVAMFAASNFPFAFSVLGGDTASALAAGCPVVVRAHPAHLRLSRAVFHRVQQVLQAQRLPSGLVGLVDGASVEHGAALVQHPDIRAVAFTGSRRGGLALQALAAQRAVPIPFFGELGSVNPLVVLPAAFSDQSPDALAAQLAASVALGMGQFCTRPGVVVMADGEAPRRFIGELARQLAAAPVHPMLTPAIAQSYLAAAQALRRSAGVHVLVEPVPEHMGPLLATVQARDFVHPAHQAALRHEVFGPAVLVVVCEDASGLAPVLESMAGALVATLWGAEADSPLARQLVAVATARAGRVLFGGVPTGVAVTRAQQHGGPWPSSTQPAFTSVGLHACERFLRPVVYQSAPAWLLAGLPT